MIASSIIFEVYVIRQKFSSRLLVYIATIFFQDQVLFE